MKGLPQKIKNILDAEIPKYHLKGHGLFVCRGDGVLVYAPQDGKKLDHASIGALLGGVWQAARALSAFIPSSELRDVFRLSFDTAAKGVYILPAQLANKEYYFGLIYDDEVNPAQLKARFREIHFQLESQMASWSETAPQPSEQYLFRDITDEEINRMFARATCNEP